MGKRNPKEENAIIDLVSPSSTSAINGDLSKHRSCWLHIVASLHPNKKRIAKKEIDKIRHFEQTSPCFLETFPTRRRSKGGIIKSEKNMKNGLDRKKKKLDTDDFECYLRNLWRSFSEDTMTSCAYLDCLWFQLYLQASYKEKVLTWIKKKNIFSKRYVFVPIVCWRHWSLLILCHFGESSESKTRTPCMLLLDSLESANPRRLEPNIRKFILDIYKSEGRPENKKLISKIPLLVPKVPQQRNGEECGKFVLYFINLFVECAPENFSIHEGYPYFMEQNWFNQEGLECFCKRLESFRK